jgi:hypothetical protein
MLSVTLDTSCAINFLSADEAPWADSTGSSRMKACPAIPMLAWPGDKQTGVWLQESRALPIIKTWLSGF